MAPRRAPTQDLEAIGTLTAGLAHEIRNPLNGALLHVRVLERALQGAPVSADAHHAVETIDRELRRLSALVDEFLEFAKPRPLNRALVDLGTVCAAARLEVADEAEAAKIPLLLDPPSEALKAEVDAERLTTAIVCLLRNGVEALQGRGGRVVLRWRREGDRVRIDVEDDGPGLGRPDEPIFDVFYSSKPKGTGLGLPIAHRIVTDHAGELSVDTSPGATTFRMLLPAHA